MNDSLGDRQKGYEKAFNYILPRRMPVILRIDGVCFHSLTKGMERPFDSRLIDTMNYTALELCRQIQGAKLAYIQSDEISILIHNYTTLNSQPWFGNEIQKMVSVSAGIASASFNYARFKQWFLDVREGKGGTFHLDSIPLATFDSRVFILPEADVTNYFLFR